MFISVEDQDDEVSELTSSTRSSGTTGSAATVTAESVKKFMKSVNRIRFNSLTATNNMDASQKKIGGKHRSRSCPQFPKIDSMDEEDEEISRSASTCNTEAESTSPSHMAVNTSDPVSITTVTLATAQPAEITSDISVASQSSSVTFSTREETILTITSTKSTEVSVSRCPVQAGGEMKGVDSEANAFVQILRQALSSSATNMCSKCQGVVDESSSGK